MVNLGILITQYMILFTSTKAGTTLNMSKAEVYYYEFLVLHLIFVLKYLLQEKIEDEPAWIKQDRDKSKNRVEQIRKDNQNLKLLDQMNDHVRPNHLLFSVLAMKHRNVHLAA